LIVEISIKENWSQLKGQTRISLDETACQELCALIFRDIKIVLDKHGGYQDGVQHLLKEEREDDISKI
jgi:hypothetical protein